jgi:hypothetical protein
MRSNESALAAAMAVIAVALLPAVRSPDAHARRVVDRPPGLSDGQWIPLGDRIGLVISDYQPGDVILAGGPWLPPSVPPLSTFPPPLAAPLIVPRLPPPSGLPVRPRARCPQRGSCQRGSIVGQLIDGYFMVKVDGRWMRLSIVQPPQVLHAQSHM